MKSKILFIVLIAVGNVLLSPFGIWAQTASPSPTPTTADSASNEPTMLGGYEVNSSIELGVRGLSVNGNHDKYRSDFNYQNGFRIFDSSFSLESKEGAGGDNLFDSLTVTSSGWGADPHGAARVNMDKTGAYTFDVNVRRMRYFNRLYNHINIGGREPGWKDADTRRNYGDVDLTIFPENENFRLRFGGSFYSTKGTAGFTTRPLSDEFPITRLVDVDSKEFRAGVDGKLLGFKTGLTLGYRRFDDGTDYTILAPHPGLNITDITVLRTLDRNYPTKGDTKFAMFNAQRSFAQRLDFTGRFIYSYTDRKFNLTEIFSGVGPASRTNPTPVFFSQDIIQAFGDARRPQSRGDLGVTYAVTDKFRISNTFSFEQFNISGNSRLSETVISQLLATGAARPTTFSGEAFGHRLNGFRRFINTIEGDYQFSPRFHLNIGYRYTNRRVREQGYNFTFSASTNNVLIEPLEATNSTNTIIAATRIKPFRNWSIFADIEHGESENAFTRLSNYNFTNYRLRSNLNYGQFTFNVSAISRDNENPSETSAFPSAANPVIPAGELIANIKNRIFSAYVDWTPDSRFSLSTGYTYHHLTSETDIIVPVGAPGPAFLRGFSQFLMRDNYAFIDITAQPIKRIGVFASYRFNKDRGQGDRTSNQINNIISSYPFRLHMPEVRVALKLTRNIDWNVGYQYYGYRESLQNAHFPPIPPNQNYTAHMPYTSLRFYFGGGER